jgi:hypothetical protein
VGVSLRSTGAGADTAGPGFARLRARDIGAAGSPRSAGSDASGALIAGDARRPTLLEAGGPQTEGGGSPRELPEGAARSNRCGAWSGISRERAGAARRGVARSTAGGVSRGTSLAGRPDWMARAPRSGVTATARSSRDDPDSAPDAGAARRGAAD